MDKASTKPRQPKVSTIRQVFGMDGVAINGDARWSPAESMSARLVGIEVELENFEHKDPISPIWMITDDGSLRNHGVEWITKPIPARLAPAALKELFLQGCSEECCFGPRTSVHVHVNVQDFPHDKVVNVIGLYAALEPLFYKFTGRGRNKNIYCVPLMDTNLMQNIGSYSIQQICGQWSKYTGLNICPIADKGTIEFRHMHGSNDVTKLSDWVDILTKMVDWVYKGEVGDIRQLLFNLDERTNIPLLLSDIFGEQRDKLKYMGYRMIQDSVATMKSMFIPATTNQKYLLERDVLSPFFTAKIKG